MSKIKSEIQNIYNSSQLFYEQYISNFKNETSIESFNKFRLYFLNIINEVNFIFFKNFLETKSYLQRWKFKWKFDKSNPNIV